MFGAIYYINLDHRLDRKGQIESELEALSWTHLATRIPAVYTPDNGAKGCLLSHILALRTFLDTGLEHALILEDDITFVSDPKPQIAEFLTDHMDSASWDVVMLASGIYGDAPYKPYAIKVLSAQTASAYAVTRSFAEKLLLFWESTVSRFETGTPHPECDMSWKELQPGFNWFCLVPKPCIQRPGYSDIQKRYENYGV